MYKIKFPEKITYWILESSTEEKLYGYTLPEQITETQHTLLFETVSEDEWKDKLLEYGIEIPEQEEF